MYEKKSLQWFGILICVWKGLLEILFHCNPLEMEFDLDKALEDVPIHVEDTSTPSSPPVVTPKQEQQQPGVIAELPSEEEKKLQHFTKLRPRRNKKTNSSKVPVSKTVQAKRLLCEEYVTTSNNFDLFT